MKSFQNNIEIKEINEFIYERKNLTYFFDYLKENKIQYEFVSFMPNSLLFIKLLTLNPKFLTLVINESNSKNFLVQYNDLKSLQKHFLMYDNIKRNTYLVFVDPSINSIKDVRGKSSYINYTKLSLYDEFKRINNTNVKVIIKKQLRSGLPFGKYYKRNKLNELTGKDWIKFTKSWFILNPPPRSKNDLFHPAKIPEILVERYIRFFTKERELVLDPFIGSGTTAIAAFNTRRSCIGIDINKKYTDIAKSKLTQKSLEKWVFNNQNPLKYEIIKEDSRNLIKIWKKNNYSLADFCITSPPYWNQLKQNHIRQEKRKKFGLATTYSDDTSDISNIDDYEIFLKTQKDIFMKVYDVLKDKGYLAVITNNIFYKGKIFPLAFDTAKSLSDKWVLKDEQIWCQDDKRLIALGINNAYVGNRHHIYCLIFRKE